MRCCAGLRGLFLLGDPVAKLLHRHGRDGLVRDEGILLWGRLPGLRLGLRRLEAELVDALADVAQLVAHLLQGLVLVGDVSRGFVERIARRACRAAVASGAGRVLQLLVVRVALLPWRLETRLVAAKAREALRVRLTELVAVVDASLRVHLG